MVISILFIILLTNKCYDTLTDLIMFKYRYPDKYYKIYEKNLSGTVADIQKIKAYMAKQRALYEKENNHCQGC